MKGLVKKVVAVTAAAVMSASLAVVAFAQTNCNHTNQHAICQITTSTYTHDPHMYGATQVCTVTVYNYHYTFYCDDCGDKIGESDVHREEHSITHN